MLYVLTSFWVFGSDLEEAPATLIYQTSNCARNDFYFALIVLCCQFGAYAKNYEKQLDRRAACVGID
jgi:hypothetical protein